MGREHFMHLIRATARKTELKYVIWKAFLYYRPTVHEEASYILCPRIPH
jgi:hypothetical protein